MKPVAAATNGLTANGNQREANLMEVSAKDPEAMSQQTDPRRIKFGNTTYQRISGSLLEGTDDEERDARPMGIKETLWWFASWMIPGMGMFLEAYYIFSIGNIKPLLKAEYPSCYKDFKTCGKTLTQIPEYIQIVGIICGMITIGYLGDKIGRKWGSVCTVSLMCVGAILLTVQNAPTDRGQVIFYIVAQFVFGYGVGGEYPMAAGSAAERAETGGKEAARHRGRAVVLTFSMQGVGNFLNTGILLILLCIFDVTTVANQKAHPNRLGGVWRTAFGIGLIPIIAIIFYRVVYLRESKMWTRAKAGQKAKDMAYLARFYWGRLLSTCGCWFFWDFGFYGNKVFQSEFIKILSPTAGITTTLAWTLLNSGVALIGYYFSAALVDNIYWGRVRIQLLGFTMVSILFFISAAKYPTLIKPNNIGVFQFIYFFSSFWGQFGPNCTTFLLAGELYPTDVRTTAHGTSAGVAKLGALWASVWFNYLGSRKRFWYAASLNTAGILLTLLFTPEPLRVPLLELDRRYAYHTAGKVYHGEAINPRNLSTVERLMGTGRNYNKQLDREDLYDDNYAEATEAGFKAYNKVSTTGAV
jgi:MFS family permease